MHIGASFFFTDYSMTPRELAVALEQRGFESLWAPEHSHFPVDRKSVFPNGGEVPKQYYDVMDPFVVLPAAAMATTTLKLGTGVRLVAQRDPIQLAKSVASLDVISNGRFLFGIGVGWNAEEMANHGTVYETRAKLVRERIEAMKEIWTKSKAEYHGEFVNFDPMMTWPKPVQKPHPPIYVGGVFPHAARRAIRYADGWMPVAALMGENSDVFKIVPKARAMLEAAGRDPADFPISLTASSENLDLLKRYRDLGIARASVSLPAAKADVILPILDRWAALIRQISN